MIRYTNSVYKCILLMLIVFNSFMATFTARISPCKVRNAIIQPQFGISANTKKTVDIIQIPPLIVQKITIGICLDNNRSFTDITQPNAPNYICKQRYSAVEVYSKEEDSTVKSPVSPIAPEQVKERLLQKLVKNFIIVEAGCDFSFNFLPIVGYQLKNSPESKSKEQIYSPEIVGISSLYDNKATKDLPPSVTNVVEVANSLMGSKSSILSPRSMRTQRTNFFRSGGHLHSNHKSLDRNSPNDNLSQVAGLDLSTNSSTANINTEKGKESTHLKPQPALVEGAANKREDEQKVVEEEVEPLEGEFHLHPDDIGLPILFLDSSMDPVLEIISRFSD